MLTVYDEYDQKQKDRKDYVRDVSSILYRLCLFFHELTVIKRNGDFDQL